LTLVIVVVLQTAVFGQVDQGAITGTVTDETAALVPGAQVKVTNTDTNFQVQTTTDSRGVYTFQPIRIGRYTLEVSAAGFAKAIRKDLELRVNQRLGVDITLQIGAQTDAVTVSANAIPLLQTEDAATGKVLSAKQINDTPLNGRNYVWIAHLTAGVIPSTISSEGAGNGSFNANGQRAVQNNFVLDGVDNNSNLADMLNGAAYVIKPPPDALQEFKIQTGSFGAEFGHSAGAVVNASLKSGTNRFTGNVWEYLRNDALNSVNLLSAVGKPEFRQNQFGGTFGGPIVKNKLFFFVDQETNNLRFGNTLTGTVPTPKMRTGDFSELLTPSLTGQGSPTLLYQFASAGAAPLTCNGQMNVMCSSQIDPLSQKLVNLYPLPNANAGKTYNNYIVSPTGSDLTYQWDTRVDYNISAKDQIFARYSWTHEEITTPGIFSGIIGGSGNKLAYSQNGALSYSHVFGPSLTNELRLGITYTQAYNHQGNYNLDVSTAFGLTGYPSLTAGGLGAINGGLPNISPSGVNSVGSGSFGPSNETQNIHQIQDNITKIAGSHTFKAGFNLQTIRWTILQPNYGRGNLVYSGKFTSIPGVNFTGFGVADFMAGMQDSAALSGVFNSDNARLYTGGYVQDDWKVSPRLTLNIGVRYDYYGASVNVYDKQGNFYPTGPLGPGYGSGVYAVPKSQTGTVPAWFQTLLAKDNIQLQYVDNRALIKAPKNNFAPRFGLAYRISNKLVFRAGYGMFFGGTENLGGYPILSTNVPWDLEQAWSSPTCTTSSCPTDGLKLATGFAVTSLNTPAFRGTNPNWKMGYSEQYNGMFEYAATPTLSFEAGYVGSASRHLPIIVGVNDGAALIAPGLNVNPYRPFPDFASTSYIIDDANGSYNSFQATVSRRYANGLSLLGTYTWSHALDDAREPFPGTGEGGFRSYNLIGYKIDYSNSPFDARQRLTFTGNYDLPLGTGRKFLNQSRVVDGVVGGWTFTWVWTPQTGSPVTINSNTTVANGPAGGCCSSGPRFAIPTGNPYSGGGSPNASNPSITCPAVVGTVQHWYNPCAFTNPLSGALILPGQVLTGTAALPFMGGDRNAIHGPGVDRINMSIYKTWKITESKSFQLRADCFNVPNHPSYGVPSQTDSSAGGQVTTARSLGNYFPDARFFQLSGKFYF
jgi:outer membrane receptor protein involved in Fe transport